MAKPKGQQDKHSITQKN